MQAADGHSQAKRRPCIAVLGAGVIGLSTALRLRQELPNADVTVIAEHFGSSTTSDGAGGLWEPYKLGDTPGEAINQWGGETFQHLQELFFSSDASDAGISMISAYQLWTEHHEDPVWRKIVPHFHHLSAAELAPFEAAGRRKYANGWCFTTFICKTRLYLPWLAQKLRAAGARIQEYKLTSLEELAEYDIVVNCTGMGAATLFGDNSIYPVRGQVMRVRAPWIKSCYFVNEDFYIIPNLDLVVLGGTAQMGDYDTAVRPDDSRRIWDGTQTIMPSLAKARIEREWVGLRPGRNTVRLEAESICLSPSKRLDAPHSGGGNTLSYHAASHELNGQPAKALHVVHNYGHGGAGITLHWGCARDAVELVRQKLRTQYLEHSMSKL